MKREDKQYIFVHGLSGWGSYDERYRKMPYWGMFGGDLIAFLRGRRYACFAASVSPEGSAWDRACELYAQLAGTRTDYGRAHSEKYGHGRYGRDFSSDPLIPGWNGGAPLVLLGHSFGGATIRMFSELMANGSPEERNGTDPEDLSDLFRGGQGGRIHALVTLSTPSNGTTAYDLFTDKSFDVSRIRIPLTDRLWGRLFSRRKQAERDGRSAEDYADFDMHIDNALALNSRISTLPGTFYFSVPCAATRDTGSGIHRPVARMMEPLYRRTSALMGSYSGKTAGGFVIDDSWRENDGLVNTVSAEAPFGAPRKTFDPDRIEPGIWQVMPLFRGDHMSLQGGMLKRRDVRAFYLDLMEMIDAIS